VAYNTARHR